jgi:hypothetical protein
MSAGRVVITFLARRAATAAAVATAANSGRRLRGGLRWRGEEDGTSQPSGIPEFPALASSKANPIPAPPYP